MSLLNRVVTGATQAMAAAPIVGMAANVVASSLPSRCKRCGERISSGMKLCDECKAR